MPIDKKLFQIGKSKKSDIVVRGLTVASRAALITLKNDGCYLTYQYGIAKPMVNGRKVTGSVKLKNGDVIEIGSTRLEFNG